MRLKIAYCVQKHHACGMLHGLGRPLNQKRLVSHRPDSADPHAFRKVLIYLEAEMTTAAIGNACLGRDLHKIIGSRPTSELGTIVN